MNEIFFETTIPFTDTPVRLIGTSFQDKARTLHSLFVSTIHELGHYLAAKYYGHQITEVVFAPSGAHVEHTWDDSPYSEAKHMAAIIIAGPMLNTIFNTLCLIALASKTSQGKNTRLKASLIHLASAFHSYLVTHEIVYAFKSYRASDSGDFGRLSRSHPSLCKIAGIALAVLGIISLTRRMEV